MKYDPLDNLHGSIFLPVVVPAPAMHHPSCDCHTQVWMEQSRHKTGARRPAERELAIGMFEPHAALRQRVDVRRLHQRMPIATQIAIQVIADQEQNVRPFCSRNGGREKNRRKNQDQRTRDVPVKKLETHGNDYFWDRMRRLRIRNPQESNSERC